MFFKKKKKKYKIVILQKKSPLNVLSLCAPSPLSLIQYTCLTKNTIRIKMITAASERCSESARSTQTRTATCVPHHHHQQATVCQQNIEP